MTVFATLLLALALGATPAGRTPTAAEQDDAACAMDIYTADAERPKAQAAFDAYLATKPGPKASKKEQQQLAKSQESARKLLAVMTSAK